jgi:hypothetical protein
MAKCSNGRPRRADTPGTSRVSNAAVFTVRHHVTAERVDLFAIDSDGGLQHRRRTDDGWESWVGRGGDLR